MRSEDPVHPSRLMPESTPASRAALAAAVHSARAAYSQANPASRQQIAAASAFLPGGNTRSVLHYAPFPLVMERAADCRLWDLDGHEYFDFLGEFTAGLYGHSNGIVRGAVTAALGKGVKGLKIGIPKEYRVDGMDARIAALWDEGAAWMKEAGAELVEPLL